MRSTVKAWFIANINIWYGVFFIISCAIIFLFLGSHSQQEQLDCIAHSIEKVIGEESVLFSVLNDISQEPNNNGTNFSWWAFAVLLLFPLPLCYTDSNNWTILGLTIFGLSIIGMFTMKFSSVYVISTAIISFITAIFIIKWTYDNIDEVISRRMRYHSSRTRLFEFSLLYSINRGAHFLLASFASIHLLAITCSILF